jgi:hypothetical protein
MLFILILSPRQAMKAPAAFVSAMCVLIWVTFKAF